MLYFSNRALNEIDDARHTPAVPAVPPRCLGA
jgi:hypothetical protein